MRSGLSSLFQFETGYRSHGLMIRSYLHVTDTWQQRARVMLSSAGAPVASDLRRQLSMRIMFRFVCGFQALRNNCFDNSSLWKLRVLFRLSKLIRQIPPTMTRLHQASDI